MLIAVFSLNPDDYGSVIYVVRADAPFDHGKEGSKRLGFVQLDDPDMEARIPKQDGFISLPYAQEVKNTDTGDTEQISLSMVIIDTSAVDPATLAIIQDPKQASPLLSDVDAPSTVQIALSTDPKLQPVPVNTSIDLGDYAKAVGAIGLGPVDSLPPQPAPVQLGK